MTWEEVDQEQLEKLYYEQELSDNEIAKLYRVTRGQVQYKRKKYGILAANKFSWYLSREDDRILGTLNQGSRERLCKKENIDGISKALTHYIFRNGVSVGRFSPFRVGLKTPISVNLKSPMHHVCY